MRHWLLLTSVCLILSVAQVIGHAAGPLPLEKKAEEKKTDDKKVDDKKPDEKKKEQEKKPDEKKDTDQEKKPDENKKSDEKKPDETTKDNKKAEVPVAQPKSGDDKKDAPEGKDDKKPEEKKDAPPAKADPGDTAWMLVSCALVLLMVPGLALFYGGMVRRKNILGTMMHSMIALAIVGVQWVLFGYALAFGKTNGGYIGWSEDLIGLQGVSPGKLFMDSTIPVYVHCMFQGMFAIITPALISGALAERIRFGPYCLFILLWSTLVYDPLAHWVWAYDINEKGEYGLVGWLGKDGALDFAGGTVVHIAAGFSALAAIFCLSKRRGYPEHPIHPSSMVLTLTGAGLLWFGWFGFNGGSAGASNAQAGLALAATQVAAAAAALSWVLAEWLHRGKPTALGLASGLVAGLVAVTPASGYVTPMAAMVIGLIAGVVCYIAVCSKALLRYDDSLDAFGVHGVGGMLGAILTGVLASHWAWSGALGKGPEDAIGKLTATSGRVDQITVQVIAALVAAGYGFVVTLVLVKGIDLIWGFRMKAEDESEGLDVTEHGEVGFDLGGGVQEEAPESSLLTPRAASAPPDGEKRFTIVIEGVSNEELLEAWSKLCQASSTPPSPPMRVVYPYVTTVEGNRFRFRGGDKEVMRTRLQQVFETALGGPVRAHIED